MARHGEKIRKRKDGRWEGRYKIGNNENGKTVYKSVYGKSYTEIKEKLKNIEVMYENEIFQKRNITFSYVISEWFDSKKLNLKKSTTHKYEYLISRHIIPDLGKISLTNLGPSTINSFAERKLEKGAIHLSKGLSKSYVRSMMLIITAAIKYAEQEGWCKNTSSKIYKPSQEKKEIKILSSFEQMTLEKKLVNDLSATSVGMLITLKTGLRIGELCALKWEDFDFTNNILYVRSTVSRIKNPKGKGTILIIDVPKTDSSSRSIPLCNDLKAILTDAKKRSNSCYVVSDKESFLSPRTFEYRYHKLMKKYNFPNLNYHALRHSFATRCIECGVDVKSLSEILGHSSVTITLNTYVHSSMELKRAQLNKLPALSA